MWIYFVVGTLFGFGLGFLWLKKLLNKSGAGGCKMCKTCDYYLKGGVTNENEL